MFGCGPKGEPPAPAANAPAANAPAARAEPLQKIEELTIADTADFQVASEHRSLAVVEHYQKKLAEQGWKKREPRSKTDRGQWKWSDLGMAAGPNEYYDAAWVDPKTGRVAVLNVWHLTDEKDVQHGSFQIYAKGEDAL